MYTKQMMKKKHINNLVTTHNTYLLLYYDVTNERTMDFNIMPKLKSITMGYKG